MFTISNAACIHRQLTISIICVILLSCASVEKEESVELAQTSETESDPVTSFVGRATIPKVISSHTPKPVTKFPIFSVDVEGVPIRDFVRALAQDAGLELVIHGSENGSVTMVLNESPLDNILDNAVGQLPVRYELSNTQIVLLDDHPYRLNYNVAYLNMQRNSDSSIRLSTQLDSISVSVDGDSAGLSSSNNSAASISNTSKNHFWDSLEKNLKLLAGSIETKNKENNSVIVNRESGVVIVRAQHKIHQQIEKFLESVVASAQKQVLIEALVVEISLNKEFQAGVDWRVLSAGDDVRNYVQNLAGSPTVDAQSIADIAAPSTLLSMIKRTASGSEISATLSLLEQFGDVKILSSPKINALNNQAAVLKVVDNKVYFSVGVQRLKADEKFEKLTTTTEIKTVPIGLVMNVIPFISKENTIILNVRPTISRILGFVADPNPDLAAAGVRNLVPEIQVREMESVLRVKDGGMVVIGGLMQERTSKEKVGVPVLSDIPLLGNIFRFEKDRKEKTELLVFLKPTVVNGESNYSNEVLRYLN